MKVISLEINEFRGIRHQIITLNGKNASVYGPNGSGKSGVVDALDFLLTGKITRLTGEGTISISLKEHGKHIDAELADSYVRGFLRFDGISQDVEVKRYVKRPTELIYDEKYTNVIEPILQLAGRGHYVLTRKNLLKYIVAKSGDRGKEIQGLLNIFDIEKARTALIKNENTQGKNLVAVKSHLQQTQDSLSNHCGLNSFSTDLVLNKINDLREILNGEPIGVISSSLLKTGIALPESVSGKVSINTTTLVIDQRKLSSFISGEYQSKFRITVESFLILSKVFLDDPKYRRLLSLENFVEKGVDLLDESGACPLCEIEWAPGELLIFLSEKLRKTQESCLKFSEVKKIGNAISNVLVDVLSSLKSLQNKGNFLTSDKLFINGYRKWQENIARTIDVINNPFEPQNLIDLQKSLGPDWIIPEYASNLLNNTMNLIASNKSERTPEQVVWDTLNQLSVLVSNWENALKQANEQEVIWQRSQQLCIAFIESRETILKELFNSITDRFVSLYRTMHGNDEKGFTADLSFTDTGMDFLVDFYGRGKKPPQALHSEGHQDSMGICLYLALAEELTEGIFNLIVLDDVVMSVDAEHRRQFSKMLSSEFPNIQFVITTHDRIWATQLRNDGVVSRKNSLEFNNWSLELGPSVYNEDTQNWDYIKELINNNKIPLASATLRRSSEQFLAAVCENLEGQVIYKSNNQRELGELGAAVVSRYKKLLKQSWSAYHSWSDLEAAQKVKLLEEDFNKVCTVREVEEWAINPSTHYNDWATFSSNDFLPVVDAFKKLFDFFICSDCGTVIRITKQKTNETSLCCKCKKINLNLEMRDKTDKLPVVDVNN